MSGPAILASVSRETRERLELYVAELTRWQRALNLVSPASLPHAWTRHVADSLQLVEHAPVDARSWLDLGSGGGLPGLVIAAARPCDPVALVESDSRKCAFLRGAARLMGVAATVHEGRIEDRVPTLSADIVTARGLAPMSRLLAYAQPLLARGALGLFLKGKQAERELTEAHESWIFEAELLASRTDPDGRIIRIRRFAGPRT